MGRPTVAPTCPAVAHPPPTAIPFFQGAFPVLSGRRGRASGADRRLNLRPSSPRHGLGGKYRWEATCRPLPDPTVGYANAEIFHVAPSGLRGNDVFRMKGGCRTRRTNPPKVADKMEGTKGHVFLGSS